MRVKAHQDVMIDVWRELLEGLFAKQRNATLDRLGGKRGRQFLRKAQTNSTSADAAAIFSQPFWTTATAAALAPLYAQLLMLAREQFTSQTGVEPGGAALMAGQNEMTSRAQMLAYRMNQTTAEQITRALSEGAAMGADQQELLARVSKVFADATGWRAQLIATTEVVGALNAAGYSIALNIEPGSVIEREWVTMHDNRVRPAHRASDGQRVLLQEPFVVGGFPAQYPGDPTLPPDLSCNCRCHVLYRVVRTAAISPASATIA